MNRGEELIARIAGASGIPSARRRNDLSRELRAHIECIVSDARRVGHSGSEIERLVLARFGDPREMCRNFAWVYRGDRAAYRLAAFAISTLIVAIVIGFAMVAVQSALAGGFGQTLDRRRVSTELLDMLATVVAYSALLSLEDLFFRRALPKAAGSLVAAAAALAGVCAAVSVKPAFVIFGLVNALFLRSVQAIIKAPGFRLVAVLACFAVFALALTRIEGLDYRRASMLVSWLALGAGYQLMTGLAERVGRGLLRRIEQL
jgi:hypothetical protein